jgi:putative addiction module CopG family antidote
MVIRVPADLEASIRRKVDSGQYHDPAEVIRAALHLLERRDRQLNALRAFVADGLAAIERGEGNELTAELMEKIDQEADDQLRRGLPPDPDVSP